MGKYIPLKLKVKVIGKGTFEGGFEAHLIPPEKVKVVEELEGCLISKNFVLTSNISSEKIADLCKEGKVLNLGGGIYVEK